MTGADADPRLDAVRFDEKGLVPAVAQDALTGEVRMVAFMSREALALTLSTGVAHFHSRSRGRLWKKGESSGHTLAVGNNVHISLHPDSAAEAQRLYDGLSAGGKIEMPLAPTPWAERYASFSDRFGVHWMVNYAGAVQFEQPAAH